MKNKTIINPETGVREDRTDYPITAVRRQLLTHWCIAIIAYIQRVCRYKLSCMKTEWR